MKVSILLTIFCAFLAWHWRWNYIPLNDSEVERETALKLMTPAIREFLKEDNGRPFYMINLIKYKEVILLGSNISISGRENYSRYSQWILPKLLARGSYPVFFALVNTTFLAPTEYFMDYDGIVIVRYRSRRDLFEIVTLSDAKEYFKHKFASIDKTIVLATIPLSPFLFEFSLIIPIILLACYIIC
jgi:hypothetical protein